jgi:uncharacterized protein YecE (DUF72 family)
MKKGNIYVGTTGFIYDCWESPSVFYPEGMNFENYLEFYSTKMNSLTVSTTYYSKPPKGIYSEWVLKVPDNFQFLVTAPKKLIETKLVDIKKIWNEFWIDDECSVFFNQKKLGCVILQFSSKFDFCDKHANRISFFVKILPKDVRFVLDLRHWSWWSDNGTKFLRGVPNNFCVSTPYIENSLVNYGWAGTLPSTRTHPAHKNKISMPTTGEFIHINFCGTYGPGLGTYDSNEFLECLAMRFLDYGKDIFCSFNNIHSTFCFPLPGIMFSGFFVLPKINSLPFYTDVDKPSCLHDALRLLDILEKCKKSIHILEKNGYVKIKFLETKKDG